jgi:hypothetical protein
MPEFGSPDWADDSKCLVCKSYMGKATVLFCSATCTDIWDLGESFREPEMDMEDACYD